MEEYSQTEWVEGDFYDVLIEARDYIHIGYRPITHPLPASGRMFLSPIRTLIITKEEQEHSIEIIEDAIEKYLRTLGKRLPDERNREDYAKIDLELFRWAVEELEMLQNLAQ